MFFFLSSNFFVICYLDLALLKKHMVDRSGQKLCKQQLGRYYNGKGFLSDIKILLTKQDGVIFWAQDIYLNNLRAIKKILLGRE